MVKEYANGNDFYEENRAFLLSDKFSEPFFRFDSPLLTLTGKDQYALKVSEGGSILLALLVDPYNILLSGDDSLAEEFVGYLTSNCYRIKDFQCPLEMGEKLVECFRREGYDFDLLLGMDFMEAKEKTSEPSEPVEHATEDDVDELYEIICNFIRDCGLHDEARKERIREKLDTYRVLRRDGRIVSIAKVHDWSDTDSKITSVYTRDEYRNMGLARIVVGNALNEIIDSGKTAVLNVDRKNPISYHLYSSLGFKRIFSQGVFALKLE